MCGQQALLLLGRQLQRAVFRERLQQLQAPHPLALPQRQPSPQFNWLSFNPYCQVLKYHQVKNEFYGLRILSFAGSILFCLIFTGLGATSGPEVDLTAGLTLDVLQPLLENPDFVQKMKVLLPEVPGGDTSSLDHAQEIKSTILSPQVII